MIPTISLEKDVLTILDQRALPSEVKRLVLKEKEDVFQAIKSLAVRGAPAIGICAAYGVAVSLRSCQAEDSEINLRKKGIEICDYLAASRPTAVNLFHALDGARQILRDDSREDILGSLFEYARNLHHRDLADSQAMAGFGQELISHGARVLTHCNTGGLATGGGGTALAVVFEAHRRGKIARVWVDETRPLLQGARLTAWELSQVGVPYQLITDSMAAMLMAQGDVDVVLVGADRIAANGDFANKIGTYSLAVLAYYHRIPFYTVAPLSSFDTLISDGTGIQIEQRDPEEVRSFQGINTAPAGAPVFNPAFDITPAELLSGIICEKGLIKPPFTSGIRKIFGEK